MNRNLPLLVLGLGLIMIGMTGASAAGGNKGHVGFVDLERTLMETKVGKSASAKFERARKRKQKELDKKKKALEKEAAALAKQRGVLKPEVFAKKGRALQEKAAKLQGTFMKLEQDLAGERAKLIKQVLDKAGPIIKSIAKEQGFTVILDRNAVAWGAAGLDITDKVNKRIK